jgi:hypothetical protein
MPKYQVSIKYGNPGQHKGSTQVITVEAESDSTAMTLATNKLKNSNSAYRDKEFEVVKVKKV